MTIYAPVRDEMIRLLSVPRLSTYSEACGGDITRAVDLYQWNLDASAALFTSIHYFEVALRNTIDVRLTKDFGADQPWFDNPSTQLSKGALSKVARARHSVASAGHGVSHGRVVAELTLGFWWTLLADDYNRSLWQPSLHQAFPSARRTRLHSEIDRIRRLRNRIAHHEPLITHDIAAEYNVVLRTAEQIDLRLAWWIDATSRVGAVLDRRPT